MPWLLDLLAPPRCALCGAAGPLVCDACRRRVPALDGVGCLRCGAPGIRDVPSCAECRGRRLGFTSARSAMVYEDEGRALVHQLKDGGLRRLAVIGADIVEQQVPVPDVDVLTWVPADPWRTIRRGYHPPELLARELGRRWSIPAGALLAAPLRRRPQRGLSPAGRRANVRDAFRARSEVSGRVCVVDDVYTTGATLSACGSALRRRGAGEVAALTLARAVRR